MIFDETGFATACGWVFAHCVDTVTGEYLCSQDVYVSVGTTLPAGAFLDEPPQAQPNFAVVRQGEEWKLVEDWRGESAYDKQTRAAHEITQLGPLDDNLTLLKPESQFDEWSESAGGWVKDARAEQASLTQQAVAHRTAMISEAANEIAALSDALDPDVVATQPPALQEQLLAWRCYRAALAVTDCTVHPVNWPQKPQ